MAKQQLGAARSEGQIQLLDHCTSRWLQARAMTCTILARQGKRMSWKIIIIFGQVAASLFHFACCRAIIV